MRVGNYDAISGRRAGGDRRSGEERDALERHGERDFIEDNIVLHRRRKRRTFQRMRIIRTQLDDDFRRRHICAGKTHTQHSIAPVFAGSWLSSAHHTNSTYSPLLALSHLLSQITPDDGRAVD